MTAAAALGWGALAASSLVIGALLALARSWSDRSVGLILAFGAGALISAVSFELAEEGAKAGGPGYLAAGLALGAVVYYVADGVIASRTAGGRGHGARVKAEDAGTALALGAFLDGIPEQLVLGIGIAAGEGVRVSLIVAIFVSNLPEAIGSASAMQKAGRSRGFILRLWAAVALICTGASVAGFGIADGTSGNLQAGINGFAAGALLVMLVDSMIPEAARKGRRAAGLMTTLGFAVAAGLSGLS